jgi:hypothetical protein
MLQVLQGSNGILGVNVLKSRGFFTEAKWYWIGTGALLGYVIVFNILFTIALSYLKRNSKVLDENCNAYIVQAHDLNHYFPDTCSLGEISANSFRRCAEGKACQYHRRNS